MVEYLDTFGTYAIGEVPASLDKSTPDPFIVLQNNPNAQLIYLIEAYPYDAAQVNVATGDGMFGALAIGEYNTSYLGGVGLVTLSDVGYATKPIDTAMPNKYYYGQVDNPFQFDVSVLSNDEFGNDNQSYGSIVIANGNGQLDYIQNYYWASRRLVVKVGTRSFKYDDFATIFDGSVADFEGDDDTFTLTIQDNRTKTDQNILSGTYSGLGGLTGSANIASDYKPLAYGVIKNAEPVLVDAVNLIYQIHDGAILSVDTVRDAGVVLTNAGDVADITTAVIAAGTYKTQLSGGYIRLGSTPLGRITMDVHGESGNGGYVSTTGAIIRRIITTRLGALPVEDAYIDGGALNRLDAVLTGDIGLYINSTMTATDAINELISGVGAYWTWTRQGLLTAGTISPPANESATITIDNIDEQGIKLERVTKPAWRISVSYAPVWSVMDASELATATTAADRDFITNEYRTLTNEDRGVRAQSKEIVEKSFTTNIANQADAQALLNRLVSLYGVKRQVFSVTIYRGLYKLYIGDKVKLVYNRFGLNSGKVFIISGISEDAETGTTVFELWG